MSKKNMDEDKGRQAMIVKRIHELMKIANVATPGPWVDSHHSFLSLVSDEDVKFQLEFSSPLDQLYVKTFNPSTVLYMLERLMELETKGRGDV